MTPADWTPREQALQQLADLLSRAHVHAAAHPDSRDIIMELCAALRAVGGDA